MPVGIGVSLSFLPWEELISFTPFPKSNQMFTGSAVSILHKQSQLLLNTSNTTS